MVKIKYRSLLVITFMMVQIFSAQNYQTVEEVNNACATLGFSANEEAEIAVDRILDQIGLFRNFVLQECPEINNAVAKNITTSSGIKERYILYDNDFFNRIDDKAGTDWAAISILAHEIGHHLNGHSLNNKGSNHQFELEADYFSGISLAKMEASLEEAQSAIQTLRYEKATSTHPAKVDRLNEIERGWNKGKGITTTKTTEEKNKEIAFSLFRKGEIAYQEYKYTEAIEYFNQAKDLGNVDAYYYLSMYYHQSVGVYRDYKKAYNFAKIGYDLGSIPATYLVAKYLDTGTGVEINEEEAKRLFQKGFQAKWFKEQFKKYKSPIYALSLSIMSKVGYGGLEVNDENAVIWLKQAASMGEPVAQYFLANRYRRGRGVEQNFTKAISLYRKAAKQNQSFALYYLGWMYFNGKGVEKDYKEALYWYLKAAEQQNPFAQFNLAYMYRKGFGVNQDNSMAVFWYNKAADQGYDSAQYELGFMYLKGYGIEKDMDKAIYWYRKAARNGFKGAQIALNNLGETW